MRSPAWLAVALVLGASPASAWTEYTYLEQNVAIQFPAKPEATKSTYDSAFAKGLPATVYATELEHVLYKLTVIDLPANRPEMGANFLKRTTDYKVQTAPTDAGPFTDVSGGDVPQSAGTLPNGGGFLQ